MKNFFARLYAYDQNPIIVVPAFLYVLVSIFVMIALIMSAIDPNVKFDNNPDNDWIVGIAALITLSTVLLFIVFKLLDLLIDRTVRDITSGARGMQNFFMGFFYHDRILKDHLFNFFVISVMLGAILSWMFLIIALVFYHPELSIVFVLVGGYFAIVKLAKFVYNVSTRLARHKADSDAHTRGK